MEVIPNQALSSCQHNPSQLRQEGLPPSSQNPCKWHTRLTRAASNATYDIVSQGLLGPWEVCSLRQSPNGIRQPSGVASEHKTAAIRMNPIQRLLFLVANTFPPIPCLYSRLLRRNLNRQNVFSISDFNNRYGVDKSEVPGNPKISEIRKNFSIYKCH